MAEYFISGGMIIMQLAIIAYAIGAVYSLQQRLKFLDKKLLDLSNEIKDLKFEVGQDN